MLFNHGPATVSYTFDDPHLVSAAGLVPVMRLGQDAGLVALADDRISLDTDKGAYPGAKTASLVAGMVAGADSIDDMDLLRHGGMKSLFGRVYAPSTLGSFLRTFPPSTSCRAVPPRTGMCVNSTRSPRGSCPAWASGR